VSIYHLGDLVKPNPGSWEVDNPDAIGLIIEMRSGLRWPEAKIIWNDMPGSPSWMRLNDVVPLKEDPHV